MPLIDVYPVIEREFSYRELLCFKAKGEDPPSRRQANTALEMAIFAANDFEDHGLPNALGEALKICKEYKECKKKMPFLKDVPYICKYRSNSKVNLSEVCREIRQLRFVLMKKQVLFHGGGWTTKNSLPQKGDELKLIEPFSTSLCPRAAAVHSLQNDNPCLWVITIRDEVDMPAFVYDNARGGYRQEKEILLVGGVKAQCRCTHKIKKFTLVEVDIIN